MCAGGFHNGSAAILLAYLEHLMMIFVHSGLRKACSPELLSLEALQTLDIGLFPPFCHSLPTGFVDKFFFVHLIYTFQPAHIKLNLLGAFSNNNNK